jgi:hypothetical protein
VEIRRIQYGKVPEATELAAAEQTNGWRGDDAMSPV